VPQHEYSAADITVLEFPESVLRRPGMYFGVGASNPAMPTRILEHAVGHALHPATRLAPVHVPIVRADIMGNLAFTIADDQAVFGDGYQGGILCCPRWELGAATVFTKHAIVEVWQHNHGLHQHLDHGHPIGPAREFTPATARGTRVTLHLDPALLAPGAAITTDLAALDLHGPDCADPTPCDLVIRDLR
jgi:hypothetical protein